MTKRRRLTGRERREQRRRARQPDRWLSWQVLAAAVAGTAIVAVSVVLVLFVFDSGGTATSKVTASLTPTPQASATVDKTGPPPTTLQPTVTASGLSIIDLEVGSGEAAAAGKTLSLHYTGWLADGTKFSSSLDTGQPFDLVLGQARVIPGWEEGLVGMKAGGRRRLIIPSELAYGESGRPPLIPPNAELTFDVELLGVTEASATPGAATPTP
jgi:hypothetical protein